MAKAVSLMMTLRDFENGYWYLGLSCGPRRFPSGREPAAGPTVSSACYAAPPA
jgi:hypothetical protein